MFSFLKKRRAEQDMRTRIGTELHRQIMLAFNKNEARTSIALPSAYTAGFVPAFIQTAFAAYSGTDGRELEAKHRRRICDGVLPKRLNEVILRQSAAYGLAANIPDRQGAGGAGRLSPSALRTAFEQGAADGQRDAAAFAARGKSLELLTTFLTAQ